MHCYYCVHKYGIYFFVAFQCINNFDSTTTQYFPKAFAFFLSRIVTKTLQFYPLLFYECSNFTHPPQIDDVVIKACAEHLRGVSFDSLDRLEGPNWKVWGVIGIVFNLARN